MDRITLADLGGLVIYAGALAAALAAIGLVARWAVLRPLKSFIDLQISERLTPPLEQVQAEVSPNSGSSLRDAVGRIETAQRELGARFTDHLTNHPPAGGS